MPIDLPPEVIRDIAATDIARGMPVLLLSIVAGIIALVRLRRQTGVAIMMITGAFLLGFSALLAPLYRAFCFEREMLGMWTYETSRWMDWVGGGFLGLLDAGGILLLVLAGFAALRAGKRSPELTAATTTASPTSSPLPPTVKATPAVPTAATAPPRVPVPIMKPPAVRRRISKGAYLGGIIGAYAVSFLLMIPGLLMIATSRDEAVAVAGSAIICVGVIPSIIAGVLLLVLVWKMWASIQDGQLTRTTPGKAVGFLFIPFFNLYWIFTVYWGWCIDFNRYSAERQVAAPRAHEGVGLTIGILMLCSMVPLIGYLPSLVNLVLLVVFMNRAIDCVNALVAHDEQSGATIPA
ncbi:MAG: hypothetical protein AAF432_02750 [Planctomycetota bacterium]